MGDEEISEVGSLAVNVAVVVLYMGILVAAVAILKHLGADYILSLCG